MTSWKNRTELRIFSEMASERNRAEIRDENSIWMNERSEVNRKIPVKRPERSESATGFERSEKVQAASVQKGGRAWVVIFF